MLPNQSARIHRLEKEAREAIIQSIQAMEYQTKLKEAITNLTQAAENNLTRCAETAEAAKLAHNKWVDELAFVKQLELSIKPEPETIHPDVAQRIYDQSRNDGS